MEQDKIKRLLQVLVLLCDKPLTAEQLSEKIGTTHRTAYRYILTFKDAGFLVDKNQNNEYSIKRFGGKFREIEDLVFFTREEAYLLKRAIECIDENTLLKQNLRKKLYSVYDFKRIADVVVEPNNRDIVHNLVDAIEGKWQVILHDYRSAHGNSVSDRRVEPFALTANYVSVWCYVPADDAVKLFKLVRIGSVEVLRSRWKYERLHVQDYLDIFRIHGREQFPVKLKLSMRAANLLMEEYPLSREYMNCLEDNIWLLETSVCSFEGISRFILGLYEDVEIIESPELKSFVRAKIARMR